MRTTGTNILTALALLFAVACGVKHLPAAEHAGRVQQPGGSVGDAAAEGAELAQYTRATDAQQMLGLPAPAGVEPALWQELVSALQRSASGLPRHPIGHERFIVDDFSLDGRNGDFIDLSWTYRNPGDYDQNGEVNGADLVFLARQLGKTSAAPDWGSAQLADGNGNGEVEFGDVTPLGQNFGNAVNGYFVLVEWQDSDSNGEVNIADIVPYGLAGALPLSGMINVNPGSNHVFVSPDDPDQTILGPAASPNPPGPWFCYQAIGVAQGALKSSGGLRRFALSVKIRSAGLIDLAGYRLSLVPYSGPDAVGVALAGRRSAIFTIPPAP